MLRQGTSRKTRTVYSPSFKMKDKIPTSLKIKKFVCNKTLFSRKYLNILLKFLIRNKIVIFLKFLQ